MTILLALQLAVPLGLDALIPAPDSNPVRADRVALGKRLFFDNDLSRNRGLSCATCHKPDYAFTDDLPLAVGIDQRRGHRRTPTIVNRAYGKSFFWDGRITTLEEQVLLPIQSPEEMDMTLSGVVARLKKSGQYPGLAVSDLSFSLASYVRTILAGDSPYDRYIAGDRTALTSEQLAGLRLFRGKGNCVTCHVGPNLTDERFHNTGTGGTEDPGRAKVSGKVEDQGAFKTPTLRDVARRAPYMHDGSLATLDEVVEHYDQARARPHLDSEIRPLRLTADERNALVAFLRSLTGVIQEGMNKNAGSSVR